MYLHCHGCDWQQDDFWDENYNPITSLEKNWKDALLGSGFLEDTFMINSKGNDVAIARRDLIAKEIEKAAFKVQGMLYRTMKEYKEENPDGWCPMCGNHKLDID